MGRQRRGNRWWGTTHWTLAVLTDVSCFWARPSVISRRRAPRRCGSVRSRRRPASRSGLIKHYFGSRDGLVAAAQQRRIVGATQQDIAGSRDALAGADDLDALMGGIRRVARHTIDRRRADIRLSRFAAIATAHGRPEARGAIGGTLSGLIDAMAELIADAQAKGVIASRRSPRGLATFIQAYSLGLLVHDLDPTPSDDEELLDIAMDAVRRIFSAG
jgi:AcrR family transcriptional regulator